MKIKFYVFFLPLIALFFAGCGSSVGMMQAKHNGKMYWNPGNCEQYRFNRNSPDTIYCFHNGVSTGVTLEPASQQEIDNEYRRRSSRNSGGTSNSYQKKYVNCKKFGAIGFDAQIYQFEGPLCPLGYIEDY